MKIGTKTVLFGTHQFLIHPVFVWIAWIYLYRRLPKFYELCAIVTHDLGYWGCENIDGEEGERHPARVANWWRFNFGTFGKRVGAEVLGHSRFYAAKNGLPLSPLFQADKLAPTLYPRALYLLMANLSGEIHEYMHHGREGKYKHEKRPHTRQWPWLHEVFSHMGSMGLHGSADPIVQQMEGLNAAEHRETFITATIEHGKAEKDKGVDHD